MLFEDAKTIFFEPGLVFTNQNANFMHNKGPCVAPQKNFQRRNGREEGRG